MLKIFITVNSVLQRNHFITQGNYKATCFDCRLVILKSVLSIVSQDVIHTLGSHRVDVGEAVRSLCSDCNTQNNIAVERHITQWLLFSANV